MLAICARMPFVPAIFRALASDPEALEAVWLQARTIYDDPCAAEATARLVAVATPPPLPDRPSPEVRQAVAPFRSELLFPLLIVASLGLSLNGQLELRPRPTARLAEPGPLPETPVAEHPGEHPLYEAIRSIYGTQHVPVMFRALAARGLLEETRAGIGPYLASPAGRAQVARVRAATQEEAPRFPGEHRHPRGRPDRPESLAGAVTSEPGKAAPNAAEEALPAAADLTATVPAAARVERRAGGPHRTKFLAAYAALALAFAGAAAGLVVLLDQPSPKPEPLWTSWVPTAITQVDRAAEIADRVSGHYRLASGRQLVGARAVPMVVQDIPVEAIAVEEPTATPDQPNISFVRASGSLEFILCGLGDSCTIAEGQSSAERGVLVNREALELALYTFKYVQGIDSVVVLRPPRKAQANEKQADVPLYAFLFRRDDLRAQLDRPLRATLPEAGRLVPGVIGKAETEAIDRLTAPRQFLFDSYQQGPDSRLYLILKHPSLGK